MGYGKKSRQQSGAAFVDSFVGLGLSLIALSCIGLFSTFDRSSPRRAHTVSPSRGLASVHTGGCGPHALEDTLFTVRWAELLDSPHAPQFESNFRLILPELERMLEQTPSSNRRLLIQAPPRMGKSFLLHRLAQWWEAQPGGIVIKLDLESPDLNNPSIEEAMNLLLDAVKNLNPERVSSSLKSWVAEYQRSPSFRRSVEIADFPQVLADVRQILRQLAPNLKPLLVVEEPVVISATQRFFLDPNEVPSQLFELLTSTANDPPPWIGVERRSENVFSINPLRALGEQDSFPDVYVEPLLFIPRTSRALPQDIANSLVKTRGGKSFVTQQLIPETPESIRTYLRQLLGAELKVELTPSAIAAIERATEGRPLAIRELVRHLPQYSRTIEEQHIIRAAGRAQGREVLLSRGSSGNFVVLISTANDPLPPISWFEQISETWSNHKNEISPSLLNDSEDFFQQWLPRLVPEGVELTPEGIRTLHQFCRGSMDRCIEVMSQFPGNLRRVDSESLHSVLMELDP